MKNNNLYGKINKVITDKIKEKDLILYKRANKILLGVFYYEK